MWFTRLIIDLNGLGRTTWIRYRPSSQERIVHSFIHLVFSSSWELTDSRHWERSCKQGCQAPYQHRKQKWLPNVILCKERELDRMGACNRGNNFELSSKHEEQWDWTPRRNLRTKSGAGKRDEHAKRKTTTVQFNQGFGRGKGVSTKSAGCIEIREINSAVWHQQGLALEECSDLRNMDLSAG